LAAHIPTEFGTLGIFPKTLGNQDKPWQLCGVKMEDGGMQRREEGKLLELLPKAGTAIAQANVY